MTKPAAFVVLAILSLTNLVGQAKVSETGWVPLSSWAKEKGFRQSVFGKQTMALTRSNITLRFQNDSQQAVINGVNIWLCEPITMHSGKACISALDLKTSIDPILAPQKNDADRLLQTICLDPGHGGKDTGCKVGQCMEKNYTLPLALELQEQLRVAGFRVWLTRTNDEFVDLDDRIARGNHLCADLFISLHFNMAPGGEGKGVEVYCLTPATASSTNVKGERSREARLQGNQLDSENVSFAYQLQKALVRGLCAEDRGVRRARFAVLRPARMPAVLIEGGFLSDSGERRKICDPIYRRQMSQAIVQGVLAYKNMLNLAATMKQANPTSLQTSR
jgi:N-acetylmuramoyl-L-alanine amidase